MHIEADVGAARAEYAAECQGHRSAAAADVEHGIVFVHQAERCDRGGQLGGGALEARDRAGMSPQPEWRDGAPVRGEGHAAAQPVERRAGASAHGSSRHGGFPVSTPSTIPHRSHPAHRPRPAATSPKCASNIRRRQARPSR